MTDYDIIASHFSHSRKYVWEDMKLFLDKIEPKAKVLDLGCGNGRILSILKDKRIDYLGIDQSRLLLQEAKKKFPGFAFNWADITENKTFTKLGKYNYILLFAVLHHILSPLNQLNLFQNIYHVLKYKGKLFLTVWNTKQNSFKNFKKVGKIINKPYNLSDGNKVVKTMSRKIYGFEPNDINLLSKRSKLTVKKYFYSKKGRKTDENEGFNLCFELEKNRI